MGESTFGKPTGVDFCGWQGNDDQFVKDVDK